MQKRLLLPIMLCFAFQLAHAQQQYSDTAIVLKPVLEQYNQRAQLWDSARNTIDVDKVMTRYYKAVPTNDTTMHSAVVYKPVQASDSVKAIGKRTKKIATVKSNSNSFNQEQVLEDITIGYATVKSTTVTGAVAKISGDAIKGMPGNDLAAFMQGRFAGVEVIKASGEPGSSAQITIRGTGSLNNPAPLCVIDGVVQPHDPTAFTAGNNINANDIASIVVMKDAGACAIYGAAAAGGVIIVTTKSGKGTIPNSNAKTVLNEQEDVDYMEDIQAAAKDNKYATYLELEPENNSNLNFYLDMSLHFYGEGLAKYTDTMMTKATALCYDTLAGQTALAFVYEYMKQYSKAIGVYHKLLSYFPDNLRLVRDLAWAYYENKQYDSAVKTFYTAIIDPGYTFDIQTIKLKDIMLADMNMVIATHKNELNIDYIPNELLKPVTTKMRILMECNNLPLAILSVKQKGKRRLGYNRTLGKDSSRLQNAGDDYSLTEFEVKGMNKKYCSISVPFYDKGLAANSPTLVRIIKITNFGEANQSIDTDIVTLDNQYGQVEVDKFLVND